MKSNRYTIAITALLMTTSMAASALEKSPKMKMTTPIPPEITTPDKVETSIGCPSSYKVGQTSG